MTSEDSQREIDNAYYSVERDKPQPQSQEDLEKLSKSFDGVGDAKESFLDTKTGILFSTWHILHGVVTLMAWNTMLNLFVVFEVLWPGNTLASILMGTYQAGALSTVLILIFLRSFSFNPNTSRLAKCLVAVGTILVILPVYKFQGKTNMMTATILLMVICICFGIGGGINQAQSYIFAKMIPRSRDQLVFVSVGQSLGGVISWAVFTLCIELIFDKKNISNMKTLCLVMVILIVTIILLDWAFFEICFRNPIFLRRMMDAQRTASQFPNEEVGKDGTHRTFVQTVLAAGPSAFRAGFVLIVTIILFPVSGPLNWPVSLTMKNLLLGLFQIGDLTSRFMPSFKILLLSDFLTTCFVYGRAVLLVPLFIIPVYARTVPLLSSAVWLTILMVFLVMTSGWPMTCSLIHTMGKAETKREAEIIANLQSIMIVGGALIGGFGSQLPLLGLKKEQ